MPATRSFLPPGAPAYQLRVSAQGWRLRVFHLPPAGHAWLHEVLASPVGEVVEFPTGASGAGSVAVLCGRDLRTLRWLCAQLAKHGIPAVSGSILAAVRCT